jgi:TAT (twin-arginine translocation) pathway signal sequence
MEPVDRRRFLKSAGVAAGAAAVVGAPGLARAATDGGAEVVDAPGAVTKQPVVVYVRDAARGEVTVMHGEQATTYRDRGLVRRLLKAARVTESGGKA